MAELKPQVYKDPRPAEYFQQFHERSRTKEPNWIYELVRAALTPVAIHAVRSKRPWSKFTFPKVTVQFGEPITFPVVKDPTRDQQFEASNTIFDPVREMYGVMVEEGRDGVRRRLREKEAAKK